jgi:hypothetical protein
MESRNLAGLGRKVTDMPAPTPQELREKAQQATRLASGITDEQAKTALLIYAQEMLDKALGLEAVATVIIAAAEAISQTGTVDTSEPDA